MDMLLWIFALIFLLPTISIACEYDNCIPKPPPCKCREQRVQFQPLIQPIHLSVPCKQPIRTDCNCFRSARIETPRVQINPCQNPNCCENPQIMCRHRNKIITPHQPWQEIMKLPPRKPTVCNKCLRKNTLIVEPSGQTPCEKSHQIATKNYNHEKLQFDLQQLLKQAQTQQSSSRQSQTQEVKVHQENSQKYPYQHFQTQDIEVKQSQSQSSNGYPLPGLQSQNLQIQTGQNQNYPFGQPQQLQHVESKQSQTQQYRNSQSQMQHTQIKQLQRLHNSNFPTSNVQPTTRQLNISKYPYTAMINQQKRAAETQDSHLNADSDHSRESRGSERISSMEETLFSY